uniref:C2H2-type domain-containing protein n=1 Tax=Araucaria cunninghamii TaxID=56994 RepID=A0A0D6QZF6_ARACU
MGSVEMRNSKRESQRKEEEEELEENYTHMCKICKKKFVSGRAFGGHMRIHGPVAMAAAAENNERKRSRAAAEIRTRDVEEEEEEGEGEGGGGGGGEFDAGYELRRHPRPSWRFVDRDNSFLLDGSSHGFESRPANSSKSRSCNTCGQEFSSWKSLLNHMKCHENIWDHQSENKAEAEPEVASEEEEEDGTESEESEAESEQHGQPMENSSSFERWMKGKRSKRPRHAADARPPHAENSLSEEEDMAICLVMLASGVDASYKPKSDESANSGSGNRKLVQHPKQLVPSEPKKRPRPRRPQSGGVAHAFDDEGKKTKYECTTCNKIFDSYQALGGHRASHKKVKGCTPRPEDDMEQEEIDVDIDNENEVQAENESLREEEEEEEITDEEQLLTMSEDLFPKPPLPIREEERTDETAPALALPVAAHVPLPPGKKNSSKVHECSICHRVFLTGQALGGHKRCHWGNGGTSEATSTVSSTKETQTQTPNNLQQQRTGRPELLDLNLPPSADEDDCIQEATTVTNNTTNNKLGVDSFMAAPSDVEAHSKISSSLPLFQSWWVDSRPKQQGHFPYHNHHSQLSPEDEVDSKLGSNIGYARPQEHYVQNRAQQPWLQL